MASTYIKGPVDLSQLKDIFSKNETVTVLFTKKNGSVRDMFCTLNNAFLPERTESQMDLKREVDKRTETFTVWDIEADAWRSFRIDSVLEVIL